jgi:uncharacterized protein
VQTVLCVGTVGPDDPTRATLPFVTALTAARAGQTVQIALMSDATALLQDRVARRVHGVGWPPLPELLREVVAEGIPILVCAGCCAMRGVSGDDLVANNARFISPQGLIELKVAADKVLAP